MQRLAGGCSCDAVRFLLKRPLFVWVCHCNACKKRTGSAYGISLPVEDDAVEVFEGATKLFTRPGESGMNVDYEFCPACGTTVRWRVERIGNRQCLEARWTTRLISKSVAKCTPTRRCRGLGSNARSQIRTRPIPIS